MFLVKILHGRRVLLSVFREGQVISVYILVGDFSLLSWLFKAVSTKLLHCKRTFSHLYLKMSL